jgi:hypothetical protein
VTHQWDPTGTHFLTLAEFPGGFNGGLAKFSSTLADRSNGWPVPAQAAADSKFHIAIRISSS